MHINTIACVEITRLCDDCSINIVWEEVYVGGLKCSSTWVRLEDLHIYGQLSIG